MTQLPARLGIAQEGLWGFLEELAVATSVAARELGMAPSRVSSADEEAQVDTLLAIGSINLYRGIVTRPRSARRVLWHVEPLPQRIARRGDRLHSSLPTGRLLDLSRQALPPLARSAAWRRWREQAANVREPKNNLAWLVRHAGSVDRIVIDTPARAEGALDSGLNFDIVPFGYHPAYAGPLGAAGPRDIGVVALGFVDPVSRRQRILAAVEDELGRANIELTRIIGHVYGADRRKVLERARVSIDVHRIRGGFPLYNFILASAAGAALVTEPLIRPEPLVPGVHYVEADTPSLAQAALELLADEPRRLRMVEAAQALLTTDLDLRRTLPRALG